MEGPDQQKVMHDLVDDCTNLLHVAGPGTQPQESLWGAVRLAKETTMQAGMYPIRFRMSEQDSRNHSVRFADSITCILPTNMDTGYNFDGDQTPHGVGQVWAEHHSKGGLLEPEHSSSRLWLTSRAANRAGWAMEHKLLEGFSWMCSLRVLLSVGSRIS